MTILRLVDPVRSSIELLTKDLGARTRATTHSQSPRGVNQDGTRPHKIIVFIHRRAALVDARWGYGADVGCVREMPIEKIGNSLRCLIPISGFQALIAPVGREGEQISLEATSGQGGVVAGIWHPDGLQGPQSFAIVTGAQDYASLDQPAQGRGKNHFSETRVVFHETQQLRKEWWARLDSNQRPNRYERSALTN
jgi:hypothetical protein